MPGCQGTVGALQYLIGRPESTFSVYDTGGTDVPIPVYDDGYTLRAAAQFASQPYKVGARGDRYRNRNAVDVTGQLTTGLWPTGGPAKALLDFATVVDGSGCLTPWSFTWVTPSIETVRHLGAYCNQLTLSASEGSPDLQAAMDLIARAEQGGVAEPGVPTFPTPSSFVFQYGHFLMSQDAGATYELMTTVDSFNLQVDNQLQPGPHAFNPTAYYNLTRSFINTGIQRVSGSMVVQYVDADISDMVRDGVRGELRLMFLHPTSQSTAVNNVAGYSAGSSVVIIVDDSSIFTVGDVIMFRTADTTKTCVATVTDVDNPGPNDITVDVLDFDIADDDPIYTEAMELRVDAFDVLSAPPQGGQADDLKQNLSFEAVDDGTGLPFTYKAE